MSRRTDRALTPALSENQRRPRRARRRPTRAPGFWRSKPLWPSALALGPDVQVAIAGPDIRPHFTDVKCVDCSRRRVDSKERVGEKGWREMGDEAGDPPAVGRPMHAAAAAMDEARWLVGALRIVDEEAVSAALECQQSSHWGPRRPVDDESDSPKSVQRDEVEAWGG